MFVNIKLKRKKWWISQKLIKIFNPDFSYGLGARLNFIYTNIPIYGIITIMSFSKKVNNKNQYPALEDHANVLVSQV